MRAKLTPAFVDKAARPAAGVEVVYWDTTLSGFGLAVTKGGHRSYVVSYRADGRKRRMHLKHGLTLTAARKEALAILGAVAKGGDPLTERRRAERAKGETLKAIVEEYVAKEGDRLRTIDERKSVLERLVLPKLRGRQIDGDIDRLEPDFAELQRART